MSRPARWGVYGDSAAAARVMIEALWDSGRDTKWISDLTDIPESRVYSITSAHVTAKKFRKDRTPF